MHPPIVSFPLYGSSSQHAPGVYYAVQSCSAVPLSSIVLALHIGSEYSLLAPETRLKIDRDSQCNFTMTTEVNESSNQSRFDDDWSWSTDSKSREVRGRISKIVSFELLANFLPPPMNAFLIKIFFAFSYSTGFANGQ